MRDVIGKAAEKAADHLSRRKILGSLGRSALGVAGVLGVMMAGLGQRAHAGGKGNPCSSRTTYYDGNGIYRHCPVGTHCERGPLAPHCVKGY